jgi:hypothetical protein
MLALFLMLTIAVTLVALPTANAHTPALTIPSWCYINAFPSPVGVNQQMSIFAWVDHVPFTANGQYGDRYGNLTITVWLPNNTTTTLGPFVSDPVGSIFEYYTPTQTGTYKFQFNFPGLTFTGDAFNPAGPMPPAIASSPTSLASTAYINDTMLPSQSDVVSVTVQQEPIALEPNYPLPSAYWTNPVSQSGHQGWASITGDWLSAGTPGSNVNDYTQPPLSAHIAWTKPINFGGVGGQPLAMASSGDNYYTYLSYEGMFSPPIIMGGQLYYNIANPPEYGFVDVNLQTGQQVWYNNGTQDPLASQGNTYQLTGQFIGYNTSAQLYPSGPQVGFGFVKQNYPQLSFGQELDYEAPNQHGLIDYLWSTYTLANGSSVWAMYDPFSGNWICDIINVPAAAAMFGASSMIQDQSGSFVSYTPSADFTTLTVWNSTATIQNSFPSNNAYIAANGYWMWRPPLGSIVQASSGTTIYNTTGVPDWAKAVSYPYGPGFAVNSNGLSLLGIEAADQVAIYSNCTSLLGETNYPTPSAYSLLAISLKPSTLGQCLWSQIYTWPSGSITLEGGYMGSGVFTLFQKETRLWMGFSATTGQQIWTTTIPEVDNHMYGVSGGIYHGVLYSGDSIGEGGTIYAYDITTGALLWNATSPSMGYTGYWDNVPMSIGLFSAGNIYWYGEEHSPGPNLEPGFKIGAMNATNGEPIWNITFWDSGGGFGAALATADGYITALNGYDNQIYAFGKGPTATTVETPLAAITQGQSLVVQGTVNDISAGTQQPAIAANFPNGVPAVSDADQTAWMEYVYMQNPCPASTTGVTVTLDAIDPNNNFVHLGTATSDAYGHYSFQVTPSMTPVTGTYTVIATFAGSNSYWPSYSESTFVVDPAPVATPTPTPPGTSVVDTYFIPAVIAIIIIIIIIGALIMLMLRRRP